MRGARGLLLSVLVLASLAARCREENDVRTPAGAFRELISAHVDRAAARIYDLVSRKTRVQFEEAARGLVELRDLIRHDFPPLEVREAALRTSGVGLIEKSSDPRLLFARVIGVERMNVDSGVRYGATIQKVTVDEARGEAEISTLAGDRFPLVREPDGVWRSRHLEALMEKHLATLRSNLAMARQYHADLEKRRAEVEARLAELRAGGPGNAGASPMTSPPGREASRKPPRGRR